MIGRQCLPFIQVTHSFSSILNIVGSEVNVELFKLVNMFQKLIWFSLKLHRKMMRWKWFIFTSQMKEQLDDSSIIHYLLIINDFERRNFRLCVFNYCLTEMPGKAVSWPMFECLTPGIIELIGHIRHEHITIDLTRDPLKTR